MARRERAEASIGIHIKVMALAEQQLSLARLRYERGLADNFDIIDAENNPARVAARLDPVEALRAG